MNLPLNKSMQQVNLQVVNIHHHKLLSLTPQLIKTKISSLSELFPNTAFENLKLSVELWNTYKNVHKL